MRPAAAVLVAIAAPVPWNSKGGEAPVLPLALPAPACAPPRGFDEAEECRVGVPSLARVREFGDGHLSHVPSRYDPSNLKNPLHDQVATVSCTG